MTLVASLVTCDGFTVESPQGCLGWVEETWLDEADHPTALAVRTADGRRGLLLAEAVQGADVDAQELFVPAGTAMLELEPPRLRSADGETTASWHASGTLRPVPATPHAAPSQPALAAVRTAAVRPQRPPWRTVAFFLGCLAALIGFEIGLAFGVAYLVTGHLT